MRSLNSTLTSLGCLGCCCCCCCFYHYHYYFIAINNYIVQTTVDISIKMQTRFPKQFYSVLIFLLSLIESIISSNDSRRQSRFPPQNDRLTQTNRRTRGRCNFLAITPLRCLSINRDSIQGGASTVSQPLFSVELFYFAKKCFFFVYENLNTHSLLGSDSARHFP